MLSNIKTEKNYTFRNDIFLGIDKQMPQLTVKNLLKQYT